MTVEQQVSRPAALWLSLGQLAARLGLPEETIRTLRRTGKAPRGTKMGRQVRFHIDDVTAWEAEKRQAGR